MGLISAASTIFDAGSMSAGFGGSMVFIKKLTASSSATLSFVDGTDGVVLDDTYKEYCFTFNNMHASASGANFQFNMSVDSGSNYNVTKTTTSFRTRLDEAGTSAGLSYETGQDLAQGTGFQNFSSNVGHGNDEAMSGNMKLFSPADTTFVKHFIADTSMCHESFYPAIINFKTAGYGNTTSAVDAIRFQFNTGNIDAGDICLYGIA
jgi:hypothetical protein